MYKCIVFDMDGVVYRGASGVPGVAAEISRLQRIVKVLFLTNNATKSRADYVKHLAAFGINVSADDVMTSSFGCAHYVREKFGKERRIFIVGESGLREELEKEAGAKLTDGKGAEIVVCGLDRQINYRKLEMALHNLEAGAHFVLANNDPTYPTENGVAPGSGAIAASLIYASGRKPDVVIGKPSLYLIDKLLEMHKINAKDAAFVGDRLDIDIRMANEAGMKSVLVLSGIAKQEDLEHAPKSDKPGIVIQSASEVGKALGI